MWRRIGAVRRNDGTFILSAVVRVWIEALAQQRGCLRATARSWPFRRWLARRRSAAWLPGTVAHLAAAVPDAGRIVRRNVYGWFVRERRGVYRLTGPGGRALAAWKVPQTAKFA